jgi:hypothetical protein
VGSANETPPFHRWRLWLSIIGGVVLVGLLLLKFLWPRPPKPRIRYINLPWFDYGSISRATDAFGDTTVIGGGAAAKVHRGTFEDGRTVAVKVSGDKSFVGGPRLLFAQYALFALQKVRPDITRRTDDFQRAERQLLNEVRHRTERPVINRMPHLLGMSESPQDKTPLLVFELAGGGDLSSSLSGREGSPRLAWRDRLRVAVDALLALWDLHTSDPHFLTLHRDFKSSNILLVRDRQGDSRGQLNDLGVATVLRGPLAKQVLEAGAAVSQSTEWGPNRVGTPAYQSYSVIATRRHTISSEIHSVGVVLLEVLTGQLASDPGPPTLVQRIGRGDLRVEDEADATADWPPQVAQQVLLLGRRCISNDVEEQPQLPEVIGVLTSLIEVGGNHLCVICRTATEEDCIACEEGHRVCQTHLKTLVRTVKAVILRRACGAVYCPLRQPAGDCRAPPYVLSDLHRLLDESTYILHWQNMMCQMKVVTDMMERRRVSESLVTAAGSEPRTQSP